MATVTLTPTKVPELIFEGYSITPDAFAGKTAAQIAALPWGIRISFPLAWMSFESMCFSIMPSLIPAD